MSGILDNKSRIIDAILTTEGRRQLAARTFAVTHVTFSDADVVYRPDETEGHDDPTTKIYLEACNLPQDQIVFEADDEGKINGFRLQDIKLNLTSKEGTIPVSPAEGVFKNGRLVANQYFHGRRVMTDGIDYNPVDKGRGFTYNDSTGVFGHILVDPTLASGKISSSLSPQFIGYVGTRGGLSPQNFAIQISGAMEILRSAPGGPNVLTSVYNGSVFLDVDSPIEKSLLYSTGTLSTPLTLELAKVGGTLLEDEVAGPDFSSQIVGILTSSFDNFMQLQTISTIDRMIGDDSFELSTNEISVDIRDISKETLCLLSSSARDYAPPTLNSIDSLFSDDKMSHLPNFMYLPPLVKTSDSVLTNKKNVAAIPDQYLLGVYPSWGDNESRLDKRKLDEYLKSYEGLSRDIKLNKTSNANNLLCQIFEIVDNTVNKLDIVDFGEIVETRQGIDMATQKVYFIGKTYIDDRGTTCFANMFTLVLTKNDETEALR